MINYKEKYFKYKLKYLKIKGGTLEGLFSKLPLEVRDKIIHSVGYHIISIKDENYPNSFNDNDLYEFNDIDTYKHYMYKKQFKEKVTKLQILFNNPIHDLVFPTNLSTLKFGDNFIQPLYKPIYALEEQNK
jgi:hypothetical protein